MQQLTISVEVLAPTGDRKDFLAHIGGLGGTDRHLRLSITRTILRIWGGEPLAAAEALTETLARSHGIVNEFPLSGFWFDSYNSDESVSGTQNKIRISGWRQFLHPTAKESLGDSLFNALDELDVVFGQRFGRPFLKSLDILFERSQALEDIESAAVDNPHFIFRVCILSGVIDRFNFSPANGSLNGLRSWLTESLGPERAQELTVTFQKVKDLRKQYPIHENFTVDAAGERHRRREVVSAEGHFGFRIDSVSPAENWTKVLSRFTGDVRALTAAIKDLP